MRARLLALIVLATGWPVTGHAHLLVTEVGYDPSDETAPTAEFVEILNPDAAPAALDAVWLCNDEEAYPLVVNGPVPSGVTADDWTYRFPAGITLAAGQVLVACHDSDAFLTAYFAGATHAARLAAFQGQPGSPVLVEVTQDGAGDGVPDLIHYGANPAGTFSLANNGESVGLATWDGSSDRVTDLDWVCWLVLTFIPNKDVDYPLGVDGPDPDFDTSFFLEDAGTGTAAPDAPDGASIHRTSVAEPGEVAVGGNGATGHDETTEDWSGWVVGPMSPGVTSLSPVGVAPVSPAALWLRAWPNPTRGDIVVGYALPRAGRAQITIHDVTGRTVAVLGESAEAAGSHRATWDGRGPRGRPVPAGLYFVRLAWESQVAQQRIVRLP
jgi:hypothetical protein